MNRNRVSQGIRALFGVLVSVGAPGAQSAASMAGSYELLVCKTACAFGDSQTPDSLGVVVLFDAPLSKKDVEDIEPFHFATPGENVRACYSGTQSEKAETFAFGTQRGVSAWEFKDNQLTFELFRSVDAGYEATLHRDGMVLHGTGSSWGAGVAAPGYSPDVIVARRVGPSDISWCAKSTTGFVDPRAADTKAVRQAVREFVASLTVSERQEFLHASQADLSLFHFGAGSRVRARYFFANSNVRQAFCGPNRHAYCDIDGASMVIVEKAWEQIRAGRDRGTTAATTQRRGGN